jgi:hypothetical protein
MAVCDLKSPALTLQKHLEVDRRDSDRVWWDVCLEQKQLSATRWQL